MLFLTECSLLPPQMLTDAQTNKSSWANHSQHVGVERNLKGEVGERSKEQKIRPKQIPETRDNKAFLTLVENLKGDPGMNSNSSDSKQRKAAFLKETAVKKSLENKLRDKAGEF